MRRDNLNEGNFDSIFKRLHNLENAVQLQSSAVSRGRLRFYNQSELLIENGALNVTGSATISGSLNMTGTSTFSGPTNMSGPFTQTGVSTFTGALSIDGPTDVTGTLSITGATDVTGDFNVTGPTTLAGATDITGDTTVTGSLDIDGPTTVTGRFETTGSVFINGAAQINGTTTINGNTTVEGRFEINGSTFLDGATRITGTTTVVGDFNVTTGGKITVGGTTIDPSLNDGAVNFASGGSLKGASGGVALQSGSSTVTVLDTFVGIGNSGTSLTFWAGAPPQLSGLTTTSNPPNVWISSSGELFRSTA